MRFHSDVAKDWCTFKTGMMESLNAFLSERFSYRLFDCFRFLSVVGLGLISGHLR